jgi:hypothetical protein
MVTKNKKDYRLAVLDFETDPFLYGREPEPFAGGVFDGECYREFWGKNCVSELVEYIKDNLDGYTIYAHNGGKFDYFFMLDFFDEDIKIINGRLSKLSMMDGSIKFRDSYNILPLPLSAHKKDEFDYTKMERPVREKNKTEILKYLHNDCLYLFEWVKKFVDRFGLKLTVSGTAYSELKKTGYEPKNTFEEYDDIFRPFYFGGRVQTFELGHVVGSHEFYDINSAYPFAMLSKHPYGNKYLEKLRIPDTENGGYFAKIKAISHGALPMRDDTGKLQFHNDDVVREYWVTGWEIISGLKTNTLDIKKVIRVFQHSQSRRFTEFVDKFYKEKLAAKIVGDKDNELHSKLMLNSCYGKFGQDPRKYKDYCLTPAHCVPPDFVPRHEQIEGEVYWELHAEHETGICIWQKPAPSDKFYNVATAASITGFVRAYLWEALCAVDRPIYCDTDSIMCHKFKGAKGDKLGEWSLECNLDDIYIGGRKFYAVHDSDNNKYKTACKGARLTSEQIITTIKTGNSFEWIKDAPSYSIKYGARFLKRKITRQF